MRLQAAKLLQKYGLAQPGGASGSEEDEDEDEGEDDEGEDGDSDDEGESADGGLSGSDAGGEGSSSSGSGSEGSESESEDPGSDAEEAEQPPRKVLRKLVLPPVARPAEKASKQSEADAADQERPSTSGRWVEPYLGKDYI